MSELLDKLRNITPLYLRQKIGPWLGYLVYFYRTRLRGRTWEPNVLSPIETLEKIEAEQLSILRFGDGELSLISGSDLGFQKYDSVLARKLTVIITDKHPDLLIGIPGMFGRLEGFEKTGFWFAIHHLFRYSKVWRELTRPDRTYGDTFITRPYLSYKDKSNADKTYQQIKKLWDQKEVVLIEGEKSRLGVGNDLFSNTRSLQRILGPAENAFSKADAIIKKASELPKDRLILLSLGPAAKVIGYELFLSGYRVIDIGHLDMEYEMFLRRSDHLIPVKYKYFNEINARDPEDCDDETYHSEIIATIL
jgi:glycosyltransferase family protein